MTTEEKIVTENGQVIEPEKALVEINHGSKLVHAMSIADIQATAKAVVASKMFAGVTNESEALVKILAGQELGLGPVASINGLYALNGKIGMMASVAGALLQKHGYHWDTVWDDVDNPTACEVTFFHASLPPNGWISRFTVADAIRAKLIKQDGAHQKYPKDMLFNRAFMSGARKVAPSVLLNMGYEYDELKEAVPYTPPIDKPRAEAAKPASAPTTIPNIPVVTADTIDCPLHPGTEARLNKWGSAYSHPTAGKASDGKTIWCNTKIEKAKKTEPTPDSTQKEPEATPAQTSEVTKPSTMPDPLTDDRDFREEITESMKALGWKNQDIIDCLRLNFDVPKLGELKLEDRPKLLKLLQQKIDEKNK